MELFKLVGSILINNKDANSQIDETKKKAKDLAKEIGEKFTKAGDKVTNVGKALMPMSAAIGGVLAASTKGASDFTNGMAKMSTMFDTSKVSVKDLSSKFLDLSNKLGISSTELAEAGYQALSAGVDVNKSVGFIETAGKLAKVGFTQTATAVDVLTTTMNAYGDSAGTAEQISNKLVRTQNLGKTTVDELAVNMGKVIPTAAAMNVGIDQLTTGYVSLTKQGIATAESTTYLNSMFNELGNSGTTLGGILKETTGMSFQDCMAQGMSLADVLQITKTYADENGIAYNELWGSAEAGKAALAILNGGVDEFNQTAGIMASNTDDISEALGKLNTPSERIKKSWERLKNTGIQLGTACLDLLTPAIDKVADVAQKLYDWFNKLSDGTKKTIGVIGGIAAAVGPVLVVGGKLISGFGKLLPHITNVISGTSSLSSVMSALTGPVGVVIGVITTLGTLFVELYKHNEKFKNAVDKGWNEIKECIGGVFDAVKDLATAFIDFFKNIFDKFVEYFRSLWDKWGSDITEIAVTAFEFIKDTVKTVMDVIKNIIKTVTALIKGDWKGVWDGIKNIAKSVWDGIKNIIKSGIDLIKSVIKLGLDIIKNTFSNIWNSIKSTVTNIINGIKSVISNGIENAKSTVSSKLNAIKDKFKSIFDSAKNIVKGAIDRIKGFFNFSWSLPKLKMPHVKISGSFSLLPPKAPHFSVDWYKKAIDTPYMFTKPTMFDVNPLGGRAKVAGEAGDEIMYGRHNLMTDISNAVSIQNKDIVNSLEYWFNKILDILAEYLPDMGNTQLVLDTGTLVAETAPMMDNELGIIQKRKERG